MSQRLRVAFVAAFCIGSIGCAATGGASLQAGSQIAIEGAIASIDTAPWAYDGNAVVQVDTSDRGRVAVQLPARWNLCKAPPVNMEALAVGVRVRAVGAAGAEGEVVVCQDESHRLAPAGSGR